MAQPRKKSGKNFLAGSAFNAAPIDPQFTAITTPAVPVSPITVAQPKPKFKLFTVEARLHAAEEARDQWGKLFVDPKDLPAAPLTPAEKKRRQRARQKAEAQAKANAFLNSVGVIMNLFRKYYVNARIASDNAEYKRTALHLFKQRHAFRKFLEKLPPEKFDVILRAWLDLIRPGEDGDVVEEGSEDIYLNDKPVNSDGEAESVGAIVNTVERRAGQGSLPARAASPKGWGSQEGRLQIFQKLVVKPLDAVDEDSVGEQKLWLINRLLMTNTNVCSVCGGPADDHLMQAWRAAEARRKDREHEYAGLGLAKFLTKEEEDPHVPAVRKLMRKSLDALQDMEAAAHPTGSVSPLTFRIFRGGQS
jgi:hypothetical protein